MGEWWPKGKAQLVATFRFAKPKTYRLRHFRDFSFKHFLHIKTFLGPSQVIKLLACSHS